MSQGNARWGLGATGAAGTPGPTGAQGPKGDPGTGSSGIALFQLTPINTSRFIGRVSAGSGIPEELTGAQVATILPAFTTSAAGLVPAPGSTSNRVLQDDGTWVAQTGGGGVASGVTLAQQAVAPPFTFQGRFTLGTGIREDLAPGQAASLIGARWGSGLQLLAAPTGGTQGRMLRDDGQWVLPSFVASGLAPAQLLPLSPLTIVGRFTVGSGTREELTGAQVGSMIGKFAGTGLGLVPVPTGATPSGMFLRDDGKWASPTGIGDAQLALVPPFTLSGRNSVSTGIAENITALAVASMLPLFTASGTQRGLVSMPTGGAAGNFLKDDGTWATPPGGAGGGANNPGLPTGSIQFNQGSGIFAGSSGMLFDTASGLVMTKPLSVASAVSRFHGITELNASGVSFGGVFGVGNSQFATLPPLTIKGRFTLGSGTAEDLSPGQVASLIPPFQGSGARGIVQGPTGGNVRSFLRDDGQWQIPLASGITNAQLAPIAAPAFRGRITAGSGSVEDLNPGQAASLLPAFFASGARGVVLGPTGGVAGNFLSDDGSWRAVSAGGTATGLTNSQFALMPPLTIKGNASSTATGAPADLTPLQVASLLGLVAIPSTTPQGLFLRDDGAFAAPTGLTNSQFALMPPSTIRGTDGITGAPQNLVGSAVATLLPVFNNVHKGLVPPGSAGSTANFLRGDGTWSPPPAGGSVSGVAFSQLQDISAPKFLGRLAGSGSIQELTPLSAASMLPLYKGSGMGLVPQATGGASGFFLRDDGQWFPLLRNEIVGPVTVGFATLAGSASVDFTQGEFHRRDLGGGTRFHLTPPSMMRHVQLSWKNLGSGYNPTFFPSQVKFAGGSGAIPSMFARASGATSVLNLFWDGAIFKATAGQDFA